MIAPEEMPRSLMQAVRYFADREVCERYMRSIKWPDGKITCPSCGSDRIGEVATRHLLRCKDCRKQVSAKVGTIFEDSPLGLDKWFVAAWCLANCKNGISSHELARALDIRQPSAWFMLHRLREAMAEETGDKFDGPAEADTTYVGGASKNMHAKRREKKIKGRGAVGKAIVHGVLQRSTDDQPSQIRAEVIGADDAERLLACVRRNVRKGVSVFTDAASAYSDLLKTYWHETVDHSQTYVRGIVHTNGLENFWSLFKRALGGTYIAVAPFHLHRYVAEQAFRFNERTKTDAARFLRLLRGVVGKRLTYRVLTAQDDAGFMGIA